MQARSMLFKGSFSRLGTEFELRKTYFYHLNFHINKDIYLLGVFGVLRVLGVALIKEELLRLLRKHNNEGYYKL